MGMILSRLLSTSARRRPRHVAAIEANTGARIDYAALDRLSDQLRDRLLALGIQRSIDSLAAILGILKAGAAYVPVDPTAPAARNVYIHGHCAVSATIVERRFAATYCDELAAVLPAVEVIVLETVGGGAGLAAALDRLNDSQPALPRALLDPRPEDLAYILYTSGSTGKPKGVMLTHGNGASFIDWCSSTFAPVDADVFSSHAPFHFDLSVLDIYLPLAHGATLVLIDEESAKDPLRLSEIIATQHISVWYSAPSILSLLAQFGKIAVHDYSSLRIVLFAGEVFPIARLRSFKNQVSQPRYFNLYGPTETNVCTAFEIPRVIPDDRVDPYPIGRTCANLESLVVNSEGQPVPPGTEGELCIAGPNVMVGYWDLPEQSAKSFLPARDGKRWYKTGDVVMEAEDGNYRYMGRRDRMIKKRGYRVELGEIEVCLYRHQLVREAAVVALADEQSGVRVKAHLSVSDGNRPSIVELKTFCSKMLPLYMVPDQFAFHEALPKTSTDKIDYVSLANLG
jgi:amino acid adenylation domain-containing protein